MMAHIVDAVRCKGAVDNASTDLGEGLHPATKIDWRGTNHQPDTAESQVCNSSIFDLILLI